jgi:glycerol-3-phosphate dehydrogenase (NAD(P)+)
VECAVALKNAYALGVALSIGLSYKREGRVFEHYNSQASLFMQAAREMFMLLREFDGTPEHNIFVGVGDLYVTVYGGRTRLVGILLGRGMNIDEAKEELNGVTLESLVVAERVARAIRVAHKLGKLEIREFPLLCHVDDIISRKMKVNIPWEDFTFCYNK